MTLIGDSLMALALYLVYLLLTGGVTASHTPGGPGTHLLTTVTAADTPGGPIGG
jgi:hypothetical protein